MNKDLLSKLPYRAPTSLKLIRLLFNIICIFIITTVTLLFTLKIHQTVDAFNGEVIAENTPFEYLAPFEAEVEKVFVKTGQAVKAGDTLLVLKNREIESAYLQTRKDLELTRENIKIYQKLLDNLGSKIAAQKTESKNLGSQLKYNQKTNNLELESLKNQVKAAERKLNITQKRLAQDDRLFQEGVISEREHQQKNKAYLDEVNEYSELYKRYRQQKEAKFNLKTDHSNKVTRQKIDELGSEYERINLQKTLQQEKVNALKLERDYKTNEENWQKLILTAKIDGNVSRTFNQKIERSAIGKGELLLTIAPDLEEKFYARLNVSQDGVKDIKMGQKTRLRLQAYHHLRYGILEGEVLHVDRDTSNTFYVLTSIHPPGEDIQLRSGFNLKGDIVIEKVRLFRFIMKKLFQI